MLERKSGVGLNSSEANTCETTPPKKTNGLVASVLTVTLVIVSQLVGSATAAVAASGNDPGDGTFKSSCATCHGQDGSGDTAVGKSMKIPDLHSAQVQSQSDAQLAEAISNGKNNCPRSREA
jgi:mono/diheme cytochrome c family protein